MDNEPDRRSPLARNFVLNVLDGSVYTLGMSLASRNTVLPLFVQKLGGDNVAVGLIPVLWWLGFSLPQLLISGKVRTVRSRRRLLLWTSLIQRLPWLLLALVTFFVVRHVGQSVGLVLFLFGYGLVAIGGSVNLPVWFDVVAQVTPVRARGRLFGVRAVLGALFGVVGGAVAEIVLERAAYPESFALLFGTAFGLTMISYVFIVLLRFESPPPQRDRQVRLATFVRTLRAALRRNPNYRRFLVAEALVMTAISVDAFYTVDAFSRFDISPGYAGRFTMVAMTAAIFGNLLFGWLADRSGHRVNLILSAALIAVSCAIALTATDVRLYGLTFVGATLTLHIRTVSQLPMIAELCGEQDRPTYVALANMLTAPFALSGLVAGWVANRFGYDIVFGMAGVMALAAVLWLLVMVEEPRRAVPASARMPSVPTPMR